MSSPDQLTAAQEGRLNYLLEDEWLAIDQNGEEIPRKTRANFKKAFAALEGPEEIHYFAKHFNWDTGHDILRDVIEDPRVDRGTLLLIYWYAGPGFYMQYQHVSQLTTDERDQIKFIKRIDALLTKARRKKAKVKFDPRDDDGYDWTTRYASEMRRPAEKHFKPVYSVRPEFFEKVQP